MSIAERTAFSSDYGRVEDMRMALRKSEMDLALKCYKERFKKVPPGIYCIYADAILSNDPKTVWAKYNKFFAAIKTSYGAKKKPRVEDL